MTEAGVGNGGAVAGSASGAEGTVVNVERGDLTVFFSIGVVVDVFLVTAFLVWAVRQWRKTKK